MKVLLVTTGTLPSGEVADALRELGLSVDLAVVKDLMFTDPERLRPLLPSNFEKEYDMVVLPGSYPWDAARVGANVFKGPEGLGLLVDIAKLGLLDKLRGDRSFEKYYEDTVRELASHRLSELRDGKLFPEEPPPIRVLSEVALTGREDRDQVVSTARSLVSDGADAVVLAPLTSDAKGLLDDVVADLSAEGIRVGVDADEVTLSRVSDLADLLLSVRPERLTSATWAAGKHLVVLVDNRQEALRAKHEGERLDVKVILDPVGRPPVVPGTWQPLQLLQRLRGVRLPKMFGVSNVVELADADTSGSVAMLIFLLAELGVSAILVEEASPKARGLTLEARLASDMASLSLLWLKPPKDVGVSLLNAKVKSSHYEYDGVRVVMYGRDQLKVTYGAGQERLINCRAECPIADVKDVVNASIPLIIAMYRMCLPWSSRWRCERV